MDYNDIINDNDRLLKALGEALRHWEAVDPYYAENIIYRSLSDTYLDVLSRNCERVWKSE